MCNEERATGGAADCSRLVAVTNRVLCEKPFLEQVARVLALQPHALVLREKDLSPDDYRQLAQAVLPLCEEAGVPCFLHGNFLDVARELGCSCIHLPFAQLERLMEDAGRSRVESGLDAFAEASVSCHSLEEVRRAQELGATCVMLGTIFQTECKPGLQGAGLDFLREACSVTPLPVFAIGGITPERMPSVMSTGAAGACMMSWFMNV